MISAEQVRDLARTLQSEGKTEQATVLSSGRVTKSDYEAAFSRLDKCVTDYDSPSRIAQRKSRM